MAFFTMKIELFWLVHFQYNHILVMIAFFGKVYFDELYPLLTELFKGNEK